VITLSAITFAQNESKIPLLGEKAPEFTGESTNGDINFPKDFGNNWKLIVSHPMDFTPVCASELLELERMQDEFIGLDVDIIVVSTDKLERHYDWIETMEEIKFKDQKSVKINFPLVDDNSMKISQKYGMLHGQYSSIGMNKDIRGVYVIDPDNIIRFMHFYPMEIGRNIHEIKRAIIALQTFERNNVYTPANWEPGDDVLLPSYLKEELSNPDVYQLSWMLTYKKL
jgi:peroxiredoxin (alkyl hydroperoxide reductase subunit C)